MNIKQLDQTYITPTYARFPVQLVKGEGSILTDETGKRYIDMGSGIGVNIFGSCDSAWLDAITSQAHQLGHTSNLYYTEPAARLAEQLCLRTGMKNVFFSNSGAEANECAIKAAKLYAAQAKGPDHHTIITLKNSFHGRTVTTLTATGQEEYHLDFLPLTPGFAHADPADVSSLEKLVQAQNCAAIMFEPIQGEGGVEALTPQFVAALVQMAKANDLLLICDEVQSGNGRSGKLFAYMHYDFTPDILTTAKGLGGGLPIGATMFGPQVANVYSPGKHGSTFGGNPICCAGALNVLSRIDDALLASVQEKSDYILTQLTGAKGVKGLSGMGLMLGIESERPAAEVIADCIEGGVLVLSAHGRVRLLPPLNIPMAELEQALVVLKQALAKEPAASS